MKNKHLLVVLLAVVLVGSIRLTSPDQKTQPRRAVLAEILTAFAWNLEHDGTIERPVVRTVGRVGFLFDDFGRCSTYGQSYRAAFPQVFEELGRELEAAASVGREADALPLTDETRAALVAIFRNHADRLR